MKFSNESLQELEKAVSERISADRFEHTLGVVKAALYIAKFVPIEDTSELHAAALLHDLTKELSPLEATNILRGLQDVSESDMVCSVVHHSLTAPEVIKRDFPEFATENILSAVKNHTTGAPDMSLFDEIIFISDYVEINRRYEKCVFLREKLYGFLRVSNDAEEAIFHLHDATVECLDNTIRHVITKMGYLHERTVETRNAFLGRRPNPLNLRGVF
jgi:predicted HD superfamily hydrolase involved in NAD metabolism